MASTHRRWLPGRRSGCSGTASGRSRRRSPPPTSSTRAPSPRCTARPGPPPARVSNRCKASPAQPSPGAALPSPAQLSPAQPSLQPAAQPSPAQPSPLTFSSLVTCAWRGTAAARGLEVEAGWSWGSLRMQKARHNDRAGRPARSQAPGWLLPPLAAACTSTAPRSARSGAARAAGPGSRGGAGRTARGATERRGGGQAGSCGGPPMHGMRGSSTSWPSRAPRPLEPSSPPSWPSALSGPEEARPTT
jgi:hypothetical protein